jgi:hypothetical protein
MSHSPTQTAESPSLGSRENFWGELSDDDPENDLGDLKRPELLTIAREECDADAPECNSAADLRELIRAARDEDEYEEPTECISTREIAEWKVHRILREAAPKYSPIARHAPPFVTPVSESVEPADLCTLTAWLWGGDADTIECSDRAALHRENATVDMTDPCAWVPKRYESAQFGSFDYRQRRRRTRYDTEFGYVSGPALGDRPREEFLGLIDVVLSNAKVEHSFSDEKIEGWRRDAQAMKAASDLSDEEALTRLLADIFDEAGD